MPLPEIHSSEDVAAWLQRDHTWLLERARVDPTRFPSLKVGRFVRFTDEHAAAILSHLQRKPDPDVVAAIDQETNGWGRPAIAVLREQRRNARGQR